MQSRKVTEVDVSELSAECFIADYMVRNRPLVVKGALDKWNLADVWTPESLGKLLGNELVQVYNNYFDLKNVLPLKQYLQQNFGRDRSHSADPPPYVRWYTKLRDVDFFWADSAFAKLQYAWKLPLFLPNDKYVFPRTQDGATSDPVRDFFPAKGLFISPRGARTSLHVDPWGSCAVMCQLYGTKRWYFYQPNQSQFLCNRFGVVDIAYPDFAKFPLFRQAELTAVYTLCAGDVIYIPHGWYHQVECDSDSVSLTWNFVHESTTDAFINWLMKGQISEFDESVLRFFFQIPPAASVASYVLQKIRQ